MAPVVAGATGNGHQMKRMRHALVQRKRCVVKLEVLGGAVI